MNLFCTQCGHQNAADALFCEACGKPLTSSGNQVQGQAPAQEPVPKSARGRWLMVAAAIVLLLAASVFVAAVLVPSGQAPPALAQLGIGIQSLERAVVGKWTFAVIEEETVEFFPDKSVSFEKMGFQSKGKWMAVGDRHIKADLNVLGVILPYLFEDVKIVGDKMSASLKVGDIDMGRLAFTRVKDGAGPSKSPAAQIVPNLMSRTDEARIIAAKQNIATIMQALKLYKLDNQRYPTTEQGLQALIAKPSTGPAAGDWKAGGYLDKVPKDPWGNSYQFLSPGIKGEIDVFSFGADGQPGGIGNNADIGSWDGDTSRRQNAAAVLTESSPRSEGSGQSKIIGTWRGTVSQLGAPAYDVSMRVNSPDDGTTEYPSLNCGGRLTGSTNARGSYTYHENIEYGRGCIDGTITIKLLDDQNMSWSWSGKGYTASARLKKFSP